MEAPPASLAELADSPLTARQHASKGDMIRSSLGKSTVQDFGYFRDILEEHVRERTHSSALQRKVCEEKLRSRGIALTVIFLSFWCFSMTGENASLKCPGELQWRFFSKDFYDYHLDLSKY